MALCVRLHAGTERLDMFVSITKAASDAFFFLCTAEFAYPACLPASLSLPFDIIKQQESVYFKAEDEWTQIFLSCTFVCIGLARMFS